jgi:heptosyltransferase III
VNSVVTATPATEPAFPHAISSSAQAANGRGLYPRILIMRPRKIGDVVLCTPLIRELRRAFPTAHLAFLTQQTCADLLATNPHLDRIHVYPNSGGQMAYLRLARILRREHFDVVIDCFSSPATARMAWITRAPHRIGYRLRGRTWAYTNPVFANPAPRYVVNSLGDLLAPLGLRVTRLEPELPLAPERVEHAQSRLERMGVGAADLLVAMVPAAEERAKLWPVERYAAIADWLISTFGAKVLFLHGPGEQEHVSAVRGAMKEQALSAIPPVDHLGDLAALVSRAGMYVGSDVGTRHMAIALGVPTVGIFGRAFAESWTPPGSAIHVCVSHDPGCKAHCVFPHCPDLACIRDIPTAWVQDAILSLMPAVRSRAHEFPQGVVLPGQSRLA